MIVQIIQSAKISIIFLLLSQMCCMAICGRTTKRPVKVPTSGLGNAEMEKIISERVKAVPKAKMVEYQNQAAKHLQSNLAKMIQVFTKNDKKIPANVRSSAKIVLKKLKAGQLTPPLANALPNLLVQIPQQQGNAGQQLGTTIQGMLQYSPQGSISPLQVLLSYVKENLNGVNALLLGTLGGAPNLLEGVVGSLLGNLGGLNDTLGGTLDSAGALLGGLLG